MARISHSWIVFLALTGLTAYVAGQAAIPATVPNRVINAKTGGSANLSCNTQGVPITICLWEKVAEQAGKSILLSINPGNAREGLNIQPGYSYLGEGLEKGQCGIIVSQAKDNDNGTWQCTLFTNTATYRGHVNFGLLRKPQPPRFEPAQLGPILEDESGLPGQSTQPKKLTCFSTKGEPKPTFKWFIDEEPLYDNLSPVSETTSTDNRTGEVIQYTYQDLNNYKFTFRDNGKKLRCVVVHEALTEGDRKEVSTDIIVNYRPRSADDGSESKRLQVSAELGEEKIVSMNVSSHPRPNFVEWTVDGKPFKEGQSSEKYDALFIKEVAPGIWEASLKVKNVEEEDLTKNVQLKVANDYGTAEFMIAISSTSTGSGGLNAGGILGIILAIIAILILVAVGVVYTRAKGILCFKGDDGTASEKERMDGGSTGVAAAAGEEKPASRRLSSRLSALYENLLAKKKDKTAPVDEEAGKDKDAKEKETGNGEGGEGAPATEEKEKKSDDIVYAELDLARSGLEHGGARPELVFRDDKTEYAEIVGVAPKVTDIDETTPVKKSPQGSPKK